jgi:hypothetical protein
MADSTPDGFMRLMRKEYLHYETVVREAHIIAQRSRVCALPPHDGGAPLDVDANLVRGCRRLPVSHGQQKRTR